MNLSDMKDQIASLSIDDLQEAVMMAMFYQELLEVTAAVEDAMVDFMTRNGRDILVAGDVSVELKEGGKTFDHEKAAQAVLADMSEDDAQAILAKATPDPKVSWSKVTTALKIKRSEIPFDQKGPQWVFTVDGKKVRTVDTDHPDTGLKWMTPPEGYGGTVPAPADISVPPGEQEPDYDADADIPF